MLRQRVITALIIVGAFVAVRGEVAEPALQHVQVVEKTSEPSVVVRQVVDLGRKVELAENAAKSGNAVVSDAVRVAVQVGPRGHLGEVHVRAFRGQKDGGAANRGTSLAEPGRHVLVRLQAPVTSVEAVARTAPVVLEQADVPVAHELLRVDLFVPA